MIFGRFNIKVAAIAGLCGAAMAFSPDAAADPLVTGGFDCIEGMAGDGVPPVAAAGPVPGAPCGAPAVAAATVPGD